MRLRRRGAFAGVLLAFACFVQAQAQHAASPVRLLDSIDLDPARFDDAFGGISGIDYDARQRRWLLLSDDRSGRAPARFYAFRMTRSDAGHWRMGHARRVVLSDAQGQPFPPPGLGREAVDPEAIRLAPNRNSLLWSSEGDGKDGYGPAVRRIDRQGRELGRIPLPANLRLNPTGRRGPRDNATIEGMDFTPDGALWLAMEGPLIEDDLPAAEGRTALVRFTRLRGDAASDDAQPRQFVYRLDAAPSSPHGTAADNGVTEILALDDQRMLVLERSGAPTGDGRFLFHCRLYLADFSQATEVAAIASLMDAEITPATKRLLLDFDTLPDNPGNLEAMAWWPSHDGRRDRIVLLNDNNFVAGEPTRLLLLALPPDLAKPTAR
ncbi:esterase-like activity of phytase family protein [Novosphingobium sp. RD2P27]|uniref:Esterase-like activity of phytase family protein n=1 Tax=Novosphingobium kalidii TaxID=3230299 RepID=A0ABV2D290_9SPHN